jgi:hypothetical protein
MANMPKKLPGLTAVLAAFVASAPTISNAAVGTGTQTGTAFTSEAVRKVIQIKAQKTQTKTTAKSRNLAMMYCCIRENCPGGGGGNVAVGVRAKPIKKMD